MELCTSCRKLIYRTDPCKGTSGACGRKDGGPKSVSTVMVEKPEVSPDPAPSGVLSKRGRGRPNMDGPSAGKSKRAEYQRDLMRKRLAEGKAKPRKKP